MHLFTHTAQHDMTNHYYNNICASEVLKTKDGLINLNEQKLSETMILGQLAE